MGDRVNDLLIGKSTLPEPTPKEESKDRLIGDTTQLDATWNKTQVDENWGLHTKEVHNDEYVEYELFSLID